MGGRAGRNIHNSSGRRRKAKYTRNGISHESDHAADTNRRQTTNTLLVHWGLRTSSADNDQKGVTTHSTPANLKRKTFECRALPYSKLVNCPVLFLQVRTKSEADRELLEC